MRLTRMERRSRFAHSTHPIKPRVGGRRSLQPCRLCGSARVVLRGPDASDQRLLSERSRLPQPRERPSPAIEARPCRLVFRSECLIATDAGPPPRVAHRGPRTARPSNRLNSHRIFRRMGSLTGALRAVISITRRAPARVRALLRLRAGKNAAKSD